MIKRRRKEIEALRKEKDKIGIQLQGQLNALKGEKEEMGTAIKALSQSTVFQAKRHFFFKKQYKGAKEEVAEEANKTETLEKEKEDALKQFYDARAQYLKEKDIREELSEEVQYLARKNNKLRKEKQKEVDVRTSLLNIMNSWESSSSTPLESGQSSSSTMITGKENAVPQNREEEHRRIKELETQLFQLTSQLDERDQYMNTMKQYLQGVEEKDMH
mmetsp:Transcript_12654/g.14725  ORF Transcript_12654/g.14725 Transcript_12654/m.14725 type:complete len:217 (-) Transcript_12654:1645-2295(-)